MFEGGITTRVPASFLQLHPHVVVMLDEPAALCVEEIRARRRPNASPPP
jgi:6-phosphogluconolactonase/glucosamine-6-phosphate isomerase/deaminase